MVQGTGKQALLQLADQLGGSYVTEPKTSQPLIKVDPFAMTANLAQRTHCWHGQCNMLLAAALCVAIGQSVMLPTMALLLQVSAPVEGGGGTSSDPDACLGHQLKSDEPVEVTF